MLYLLFYNYFLYITRFFKHSTTQELQEWNSFCHLAYIKNINKRNVIAMCSDFIVMVLQ